jgi:predicted  nucleic acid-binding Zn-ribbon protein
LLEQHIEELRHANTILCSGMPPPSDQDCKLQVAYRHLSEAEHGWHYFRQQLDAAREMLDERTHAIIHLEHHVEKQDLDLEQRATTIADLEQQLQVLQLQVSPAPTAPAAPVEPDAESDVDEE